VITFSWPSESSVKIRSNSLGTHLTVESPESRCTIEVPEGMILSPEVDLEGRVTYYLYMPAREISKKLTPQEELLRSETEQ
jgi:hypothetical protein